MSDTLQTSTIVPGPATGSATGPATPLAPTPLALALTAETPTLPLASCGGALVPASFDGLEAEFAALTRSAAIFDLDYSVRLAVTGGDRLRWLNGMASNSVTALPEGHGNYNLLLNAQGRIQGDGYIFREADRLLLETDLSQATRLFAHLDHFIIMDDVELSTPEAFAASPQAATLGVAGPAAPTLLASLSLEAALSLEPLQFVAATLGGVIPVTLVRAHGVLMPHFELWLASAQVSEAWALLKNAGAVPAGLHALETLRVLEGVPVYGVDILEKHLAQETSQTRALHFNKGCYLGQEIVERIRSRATVHRFLRQLALTGETPAPGTELHSPGEDRAAGVLTSVAALPDGSGILAVGYVRSELIERRTPLAYSGGTAVVLDTPPALPG